MIEQREADPADIDFVFRNLSARTAEEVAAFVSGLVEARASVDRWNAECRARVITLNGIVVAVYGSYRSGDHRETWFLGTEPFFHSRFVRATRRWVSDLGRHFEGERIISRSRSTNGDTNRWFEMIGFKEVESPSNLSGERWYELRAVGRQKP